MRLGEQELEQMVGEHYAALYRFAYSLAKNEAEAADLTQQTYYTLATRGGRLRDRSKAKSWLFTTLYREFLKLRRHTNRHTDIEALEPGTMMTNTVDENACRSADAGLVMECLCEIPEIFRAPLALFYLDDLTYREIAGILDLPLGTVMSRLSRGKEELRTRLAASLRTEVPGNLIRIPKASND